MNKERKLIIAGNWKMNKTVAEALDLVNDLKRELANVKEVDIVVCPPFTALGEVSKAILDDSAADRHLLVVIAYRAEEVSERASAREDSLARLARCVGRGG